MRCCNAMETPVAFILEGIGDNILALPAIRALAVLARGRLHLICHRDAYELFYRDLELRNLSLVETTDVSRFSTPEFASSIGDGTAQCDVLFCFNRAYDAITRAILALVKPTVAIGFFPDYDICIPFSHEEHASDLAFRIAQTVDSRLCKHDFVWPIALPTAATEIAKELKSQLSPSFELVAAHFETALPKRWSEEAVSALVAGWLARHPRCVILDLRRGVSPVYPEVSRWLSASGLPLPVALAVAGYADAFIGVDSCMMHMADFSGVPTLALFSTTTPEEFGPCFTRISASCVSTGRTDNDVTSALDAMQRLFKHEINA